jgi:oxygen-independent coproporphyrinogen-3 oxidase
MTTLAPPESSRSPAAEPLVGNYFVAAYPPFSVWNSNDVSALKSALNQPSSGPLGLYVHIPFCQRKCDYCYYLSYSDQKIGTVNRYLEGVVHELEMYSQRPALQDRKVSFAYFGGGTPSILTTDQVSFLAEGLHGLLDWDSVEEVTFEVAPRSVRPQFLEALRGLGVTRISMGVQSFDDGLLKMNGRIHLARDVVHAYQQIREAGFAWINLDLMCGMIGETPEQWHHTLREVLKLSPDSVTIYQTEVPHNTQLYRDWRAGRIRELPSWETKRTRLLYGFHALERAGYTVVSAYNAVKEPEQHHFKYQDYLWRGTDMLGLGVAAFR